MELSPTSPRTLELNGIPNAVALVRVGGVKAKELADLTLHHYDLSSALAYLEAIRDATSDLVGEGLYVAALTLYFKCFQNSASRKAFLLDPGTIFAGDSDAQGAFKYYKDLRNKHVVHDENTYAQAHVAAALNNGDQPYKVEKIVSFAASMQLAHEAHWNNLHLLISRTLDFIASELARLQDEITTELERESYQDLIAGEPVVLTSPVGIDPAQKRSSQHLE